MKKKSKSILLTLIFSFIFSSVGFANSQTAVKTYNAGKYEVGKDMPYGVYVFYADNDDIAEIKLSSISANKYSRDMSKFFTDSYIVEIAECKPGNTAYFKTNPHLNIAPYGSNMSIELTNCHAILSSQLDAQDTAYNGIYRVGKDIAPGIYTFTKADGCDFACVKQDKNKLLTDNQVHIVNEPVSLTLNKNSTIQIVNCNISYMGTTTKHKERDKSFNIDMDMSKVSAELKSAVSSDIKKYISPEYTKSQDIITLADKTKKSWNSLAKTAEDKKYTEIASSAIDKCYVFTVYCSNLTPLVYERGIPVLATQSNDKYNGEKKKALEEQSKSQKALEDRLNACLDKLLSAETFNDMQKYCSEMNNYMGRAGIVDGYIGTTIVYSDKNNYWN